MITAHCESLRGMSLDVLDVNKKPRTIRFNVDGLCENIDPDLAVVLFSFPGVIVKGLDAETKKVAKQRKDLLRAEASKDTLSRMSGISAGGVTTDTKAGKVTGGVAKLDTTPLGKVAKEVRLAEMLIQKRARPAAR